MPVELTERWFELESDPGLFTLLLEEFGVKGVQVEEIYDLQKPIEDLVLGFIFLFRWAEGKHHRNDVEQSGNDEEANKNLFFATQMVPNSCATHSLVSLLLNCPQVELGETLYRLKERTVGMSPEKKGFIIGNTPELAKAHNSHAISAERQKAEDEPEISPRGSKDDAYHFVCYVPVDGNLYELDGLKRSPVNHGQWPENSDWISKFREVIKDRLPAEKCDSDIRYNLMAVIPDRRVIYEQKLQILRTNKDIIYGAIKRMILNNGNGRKSPSTDTSKPGPSTKRSFRSSSPSLEVSPLLERRISIIAPSPTSENASERTAECKDSGLLSIETEQGSDLATQNSTKCTPSSLGQASDNMVVIKIAPDEDSGTTDSTEKLGLDGSSTISSNEEKTCAPNAALELSPNKRWNLPATLSFGLGDLFAFYKRLDVEIQRYDALLEGEIEKRNQYKVDDARRVHNYDQFITTFMFMLAQQKLLGPLVRGNSSTSQE